MKKIEIVFIVVIMVISGALCSCGAPAGTQNRETSDFARAETAEERKVSQRLIQLTHEHRSKLGLPKLASDTYLKSLAMEHSLYVAKNHRGVGDIRSIAHAGVHQRSEVLRLRKGQALGENVAWHDGYANSVGDQLFKTLMNSESHRKAIEQKNWEKMGISVSKGGNTFYATQLFTRPYIKPAPIPHMIFL